MATVSVSRLIDAPIEKVWASWDDFGAIQRFNPNLNASFLINSSAPTGLGAMRQCDLSDGKNYIRERVIDYRPHERLTIDIYEGTLPMKSAEARFDFKPRRGQTEVTMQMDFVPKFGLLGRLIVAPMMKPQLAKMMAKLLAGNADFVERGVELRPVAA